MGRVNEVKDGESDGDIRGIDCQGLSNSQRSGGEHGRSRDQTKVHGWQ